MPTSTVEMISGFLSWVGLGIMASAAAGTVMVFALCRVQYYAAWAEEDTRFVHDIGMMQRPIR